MRILILGAGATGGYFGGRLAAAGADVTFLVRPPRAAVLAAQGLTVTSPEGDLHLPVATVTAETLTTPYDLVIMSCKAYDLEPAIAAIMPAVGAQTRILPLLNGLNHLDRLDAQFGSPRVLGGLCVISVTVDDKGAILHLNRAHSLIFGDRGGDPGEPPAAAIERVFAGARFVSRASPDIVQEMWDKFVFLTTFAAMTCLMRAAVGTIAATRDGAALTRELFAECAQIAAAAGHPVAAGLATMTLAQLTDTASGMTASMLRDIEGGFPIEGDHVVGDMLRRAVDLGVATPLLRVAYCHLQSYESRRRAGLAGP